MGRFPAKTPKKTSPLDPGLKFENGLASAFTKREKGVAFRFSNKQNVPEEAQVRQSEPNKAMANKQGAFLKTPSLPIKRPKTPGFFCKKKWPHITISKTGLRPSSEPSESEESDSESPVRASEQAADENI